VELRLDLPVGHDIILFGEVQRFIRLAELGGAEPSDPVVGVTSGDDDKNPEALRIAVLGPAKWIPTITIVKQAVPVGNETPRCPIPTMRAPRRAVLLKQRRTCEGGRGS
jgi:hypothetical protein